MMIVNPFGTKQELWTEANVLVDEFLANNSILPKPKIKIVDNLPAYGNCYRKLINVNLKKCRVATRNPGFTWTYPGFKADLTPIGVLAHELGHFVHFALGDHDYNTIVGKIRKQESNVSSYEPNVWETFAESMKLFITNPNLLKVGRPLRYKLLTETMKLQPAHDIFWKVVLEQAHPKFHTAAQNWIRNK